MGPEKTDKYFYKLSLFMTLLKFKFQNITKKTLNMTHFCLTWEWLWLFNNKLHGFDLISKLVKIKYHLSRSLQVCGPNLSGFILSFFFP